MKLKLQLQVAGARCEDIVVTADATATVGDVASALARGNETLGFHDEQTEAVTLRLSRSDGRFIMTLPRHVSIGDAGLRSGSIVEVTSEAGATRQPAVLVRVLEGPDRGQTYAVMPGSVEIGRAVNETGIRLSDDSVSRRHARLVVGAGIEIEDLDSFNGVKIAGSLVHRGVINPGDRVALGDTVLSVEYLTGKGAGDFAESQTLFNRSPLVAPVFVAEEFPAPKPPDPEKPDKLPLIAMLAPLIMGVVMFLMTRNALSIIFVALSPVIALATYIDRRVTERRRVRSEEERFSEELDKLGDHLRQAQAAERQARLAEAPSTADVLAAAQGLDVLLWHRRPDAANFLTLRLGLGADESRTTLKLPDRGQARDDDWERLVQLEKRYRVIEDVPILVSLPESGGLGVCGPHDAAENTARALMAQMVGLHSPAEMVLVALGGRSSARVWEWLKWLPHTGSVYSPIAGDSLAATPAEAAILVTKLEELVGARQMDKTPAKIPAIVVLVDGDIGVDLGRLVSLVEAGPQVGVYFLWVADRIDQLPAGCRSYVDVSGQTSEITNPDDKITNSDNFVVPVGGDEMARTIGFTGLPAPAGAMARVGFVLQNRIIEQVACETLHLDDAARLAWWLTAVVDAGAPVLDQSDLPRVVPFPVVVGPAVLSDPGAVIDVWQENGTIIDRSGGEVTVRRRDAPLRGVVGQGTTREFSLDLRAQGPHALVGGTTGAGKSEFLQSWVLGLAAQNSPDRVTFLFVDYKGGAAFADCVNLPHCVGLVTDLSIRLVNRALTSLHAELRRREYILNAKHAKDLVTLERSGDPETPPSLVIIVDEFAALVGEVPEFVDGMVDVAQRGRSLGLHLILATQRPAGVIKDNLRANTNLRVALRMADEADSADVLGDPMAARFDPGIPGRAAVRTGPGRIAVFQTGYAGGHTTDQPAPARIEVMSLTFGAARVWDIPAPKAAVLQDQESGPTDITRIVDTISRAAAQAGLPQPRKPWLPELAEAYSLETLGHDKQPTGEAWALGIVDDPNQQEQYPYWYCPDIEGHLAVFGATASGKSAVLRTVAVQATRNWAGYPVQVYGLDCGGNGLAMLESLPSVGSIIAGADAERVHRLLGALCDLIDKRTALFAKANASSLTQYRALTGDKEICRVVLLVDGLAAFRDAYEGSVMTAKTFAMFCRTITDGRPVGVTVAVTCERPNALPSALASAITSRFILRQAEEGAYQLLGLPKNALDADAPDGRGVFAGDTREIQIAVPSGSSDSARQAAAIAALSEELKVQTMPVTPDIKRLPDMIRLEELPPAVNNCPVLGIEEESLAPFALHPAGTFLLGGLPGSGRSTVLMSIAQAIRRWGQDVPLYYFGLSRSELPAFTGWTDIATTEEDVTTLAETVLARCQTPAGGGNPVCVVVEGINDFLFGDAEKPLTDLVRLARRNGHFVVAEAESSSWGTSWSLIQEIRSPRRGMILQPDKDDGETLLHTPFPRVQRSDFPPGRGIVAESGKTWTVQVALPGEV